MQPISATDAIGLAFTHARSILFPRPFRLGRFFKLALVAAVTQATFLSVSIGYPLQGAQLGALTGMRRAHPENFLSPASFLAPQPFAPDHFASSGGGLALLGLGVILAIVVFSLLFALAYLYVIARTRATLFDLVVYRGGRVRQAWRRQARAGRIYFGLYLLAMLLFWVAMAALIGPFVITFVKAAIAQAHGMASRTGIAGGFPPQLASQFLLMIGLVWLLLPIWLAVDALLQDFILPGLALAPTPGAGELFANQGNPTPQGNPDDNSQGSPVAQAFRRFGQLLRRSPGQLLLFLILRTVVAFAIAMALGLATLIVLGVLALVAFGIGRLLYGMLWTGGLGAHAVFFGAAAAMALPLAVLYLLAVVSIYGVTGTFKTSYAAWFYSGYYPELARLLGPQPPDDEALAAVGLPGQPPLPPLKARADLPSEVW